MSLKSEEYKALRDQILASQRIQVQVAITSPAISLAYVAAMIGKSGLPTGPESCALLVPAIFLVCSLFFVSERRRAIACASTYIAMFHEEQPGWETRIRAFFRRERGDRRLTSFAFLRSALIGSVLSMTVWSHVMLVCVCVALNVVGLYRADSVWQWYLAPIGVFVGFILITILVMLLAFGQSSRLLQRWADIRDAEESQDASTPEVSSREREDNIE